MEERKINSIRILVKAFYDYQQERMNIDGRLGIKKDGTDKKGTPVKDEEMLYYLHKSRTRIIEQEKQLAKDITNTVHTYDLWNKFLVDVKGCGELMAAVIISEFDIHKAPNVSNLWSFAGLAPGKDKKIKGQKCTYNQFLRAKLCGVLGSSFLKSNSPYREYYDNMRQRLESKNWGEESKNPSGKNKKAGHQHNASIRYMVKMFLKDLYVAWRTLENLPVRAPYQEEYLGHVHKKAG